MSCRVDEAKITAHVRTSTEDERKEVFDQPTHKTTMLVLEEDGKPVGHVCLSLDSLGNCLAHDFECHSQDPHGVLKLGRAAKKQARKLGVSKIVATIPVGSQRRVLDFWVKCGFLPKHLILELDL